MSIILTHSLSACCKAQVYYSPLTEDLVCSACYDYCATIKAPTDIPPEYYQQRDAAQKQLIAEVASYD